MTDKERKLIVALQSILKTAAEHPCFDRELFEARDIDALANAGGDICDWTMIAVIAADALKEAGE